MKNNIIYLLVLIGLCACSKKSGDLPEVEFSNISAIDLKNEISLDSIVEQTNIIRIKSDSNLIIGKVKNVFESKDNFYVVENNRIVRLDKEGKFLNLIGMKGKGPGEYITPWKMDVDEINQHIYVLDYFGRKMLRYHFDGTFDRKYNLPENFSLNGFSLYQGKILYTAVVNSVSPEVFCYDQKNDETTELSIRDREMLVGEGLLGDNFIAGNKEAPFFYHYFNDTVFSIENNQLKPAYLLQFGKLKIKFDELNLDKNKRPNGPRAQVYNMVRSDNFTFLTYGATKLKNSRQQTLVTGFYKNDLSVNTPCVNFISNKNPLLTIPTGKYFSPGFGNTLLRIVNAVDVLSIDPDFDIEIDDNPVLIKYYLK
ncbi:6-bladed beta-propeller [Puteibacter caeruleilacunae]|nr:6-bladed beta-propeller [Puteibacter caeruleilacunae]